MRQKRAVAGQDEQQKVDEGRTQQRAVWLLLTKPEASAGPPFASDATLHGSEWRTLTVAWADETLATSLGEQVETLETHMIHHHDLAQLLERKEALASTERHPPSPRSSSGHLSPREQQVLELVQQGLRNRDIGLILGLSEKTVKHHMTKIMRRLGVRNRVEAALHAKSSS